MCDDLPQYAPSDLPPPFEAFGAHVTWKLVACENNCANSKCWQYTIDKCKEHNAIAKEMLKKLNMTMGITRNKKFATEFRTKRVKQKQQMEEEESELEEELEAEAEAELQKSDSESEAEAEASESESDASDILLDESESEADIEDDSEASESIASESETEVEIEAAPKKKTNGKKRLV